MQFFHVDPTNDDAFDAWFNVLNRSELDRKNGDGTGWLASERRARAAVSTTDKYDRLYNYGDDLLHPVAVGSLEITTDHEEFIRGELHVDPAHRRKGHGAEALAHLEHEALAAGRPSLVIYVRESGDDLGHGLSRMFAPKFGYFVIEEMLARSLDWPRPEGELDRLEAEWATLARDYEILSWRDNVPDEYLSERARLAEIMPHEVPADDFDWGDEHWDEARIRAHEQTVHDMGRDLLVAVAHHLATDELAGFSELTVARDQPETAYQWDTLVVSQHRGHRLGGLMKIATMRLLAEGGYETKMIRTYNAAINGPMIAINDQLGTTVSGGMVAWRRFLQ